MKPRVNLKGFRPGKAPVSFLKKQFGKSVMGEVVEQAVNEGSQKAISDNQLKPALQPRVEPVGDVQEVVDGKADLQFTVTVDLMPDFETHRRLQADGRAPDLRSHRRRNRRSAGPTGQAEPQLCHARRRRSRRRRTMSCRSISWAASTACEFEGGKGEDFNLTLGSGQFIPGFEDQLIGAKAGEEREVKVTFPAEYHAAELAGKDAVFAVTVKEIKTPEEAKIDDELAKKLGLDDLADARRTACAIR